jgi:hypothetical protein
VGNEHINLRVKGVNGEVIFKIKKKMVLKKLMEAYCDRQKLKMTDTVFLFAGKNLLETQSADELKMQDDDVIEAKRRWKAEPSPAAASPNKKEKQNMPGKTCNTLKSSTQGDPSPVKEQASNGGGKKVADDESDDDAPLGSKSKSSPAAKKPIADEDSDDDAPLKSKAKIPAQQQEKKLAADSESDDDKPMATKLPPKKSAAKEVDKLKAKEAPKKRKVDSSSDDSSSDSEDDAPLKKQKTRDGGSSKKSQ